MSYALWEGLAVASAPSPLLAAAEAGIDASPAAAGAAPRTRPARPIAGRPDACRARHAHGVGHRPLPQRTHQDFHRSTANVQASKTMPVMVNRGARAAQPSRASRSAGLRHAAGGTRVGSTTAHHDALAAPAREAERKISGGVGPAAMPDSGASPGPHASSGAATG
ncbi:hypothetical protein [Burkholderia plantarii]|uniref:hypothetical protein n=1 Tax=Burkholderia plantarii TaxID=41899 RepID=UPI0018DB187C|nr:hypothetical protein [Burkholderia plantarii]MBI0326640.1 hypothetical protein [Burkholderia plantarii]